MQPRLYSQNWVALWVVFVSGLEKEEKCHRRNRHISGCIYPKHLLFLQKQSTSVYCIYIKVISAYELKCSLLMRKDMLYMEAVHSTLQGPRPGVSHSSQIMHLLHFCEMIPWDFQTHLPPLQPLVSAHLQNVWRFNMWRPETCLS